MKNVYARQKAQRGISAPLLIHWHGPGLDRADGEQGGGHHQGHGEQAGGGSDIECHDVVSLVCVDGDVMRSPRV